MQANYHTLRACLDVWNFCEPFVGVAFMSKSSFMQLFFSISCSEWGQQVSVAPKGCNFPITAASHMQSKDAKWAGDKMLLRWYPC